MSRIGKLPVVVPSAVVVTLDSGAVLVKGPKGELRQTILSEIVDVKLENGNVIVERKGEAKEHRAAHGLTRTLIANMVEGVSKGFRKSLEIQGVGYRVAKAGEKLNLSLGSGRVRSAQRRRAFGRGAEQNPRRGDRQTSRRPGRGGNSAASAARALQR